MSSKIKTSLINMQHYHPNPNVKRVAKDIAKYIDDDVTDSEALELTQDLLNNLKIEEESESIKNKQAFRQAIDIIQFFISSFT